MNAAEGENVATSPRPRVLVLLATYNGRQWIEEQLDSILAQREVAVSVLVSDDCSTDGTAEFIDNASRSDSRVRVLSNRQASGSAGSNFRRLFAGANAQGHDFVALADQDDVWLDDKLARAAKRLHATCAAGYSSTVTAFWPDGREKSVAQEARQRDADFLFEGAGQGCTFVIDAALFRDVSRFCSEHAALAGALHYHDWLVYELARVSGRSWTFDGESRIRYRQHDSNEIGARGGAGAIRSRLAKIRNGWFRTQVVAAMRIYEAFPARNPIVDRFGECFALNAKPSLVNRVVLAALLARHSRRRLSDRLVLVIAALWGWLDPP